MVPLEEWHLRFFFGAEELETLLNSWFYGQTLLSAEGAPIGFGGVYTQPNDKGEPVAIAFFYGGPNQIFMRKYIKLALRAFAEVFADLARMGVTHIYAIADKRIERSVTLARWLGGTPTGDSQEEGELYVFDPRTTPLARFQE
jgi:hypothetical protein